MARHLASIGFVVKCIKSFLGLSDSSAKPVATAPAARRLWGSALTMLLAGY